MTACRDIKVSIVSQREFEGYSSLWQLLGHFKYKLLVKSNGNQMVEEKGREMRTVSLYVATLTRISEDAKNGNFYF